jgi:hypothetical protein
MPGEAWGPERPTDLTSYRRWLERKHGVIVGPPLITRYETIVAKARDDFLESAFWQRIVASLNELDGKYRLRAANYPLFLTHGVPKVQVKSFDSFFLKTFRRNVLDNNEWPEPPAGGWLVPDDWYSQVNDLIRTAFVVKYLDGVRFLGERFAELGAELGLRSELSFEARMEGHYAAHLCVRDDFEIPGEKWDTKSIPMSVEIQITTQLQEAIRRLLHKYYEARRKLPERDRSAWQWEYESDEFVANYLGHILHYVEGMIMEVRSRQEDPQGAYK